MPIAMPRAKGTGALGQLGESREHDLSSPLDGLDAQSRAALGCGVERLALPGKNALELRHAHEAEPPERIPREVLEPCETGTQRQRVKHYQQPSGLEPDLPEPQRRADDRAQ